MNKPDGIYLEAFFNTGRYWDDPVYELIKSNFSDMPSGDHNMVAIDFARWVFRHPDAQYVKLVRVENGQSDTILNRQKLGFWLGCQLVGLKFKLERFLEEQMEVIKNLKKELEELN